MCIPVLHQRCTYWCPPCCRAKKPKKGGAAHPGAAADLAAIPEAAELAEGSDAPAAALEQQQHLECGTGGPHAATGGAARVSEASTAVYSLGRGDEEAEGDEEELDGSMEEEEEGAYGGTPTTPLGDEDEAVAVLQVRRVGGRRGRHATSASCRLAGDMHRSGSRLAHPEGRCSTVLAACSPSSLSPLQAQVQQLIGDLQRAEERCVLLEADVRAEVAEEMGQVSPGGVHGRCMCVWLGGGGGGGRGRGGG